MRKALTIFAVVFIILFLLATELIIPPIQIGFHLAFGWIAFLKRTLPQITFNFSAVALALICVVLIICGMHWFCSWFYPQVVNGNEKVEKPAWSLRWTFGICVAMLLLFSTSIAITGICHQTAWWLTSKEPMYVSRVERIRNISDMKQQALEIRISAEDNHWNLQAIETNLMHSAFLLTPRCSIENWHRVLIPGTNGELVAAFIFHRDPTKRAKAGFCFVNREACDIYPIQKLSEQIAKYGLQQEGLLSTIPDSVR